MIRISISLLCGLLIALTLFWLMQWMISNHQQRFKKTENLQMTEFVRLKQDSKLKTRERKTTPPPPPKKPPPPPPQLAMQQAQVSTQIVPNMALPNLDIPLPSSRFANTMNGIMGGIQMGKGQISTNVIPLLRIPPRYPMRAARRKIEGWVKVEFTITEQGTVKDAMIVASQPADVFNQAALRAINKWKFKPRVIDGVTFEQKAVQILQFKLSK